MSVGSQKRSAELTDKRRGARSEERWNAVADRARQLSVAGRAVLVGTRSMEASELLGRLLTARNVPHQVLKARQDEEEADIVAQAGEPVLPRYLSPSSSYKHRQLEMSG